VRWPRGIRALLPPGSPESCGLAKPAVETNADADIAEGVAQEREIRRRIPIAPSPAVALPGQEHDGEQVFLGLIVELQRADQGEIAPAIVVAVEEAQLLLPVRRVVPWDRGRS